MARITVADVLVDGLVRAGVARLFATPDTSPDLGAAAGRRALPIVTVPDATSAAVLAAVTGEVGDAPGAMLATLADAPGLGRGLAHAQRDRAPLVVITDAGADAGLLAPVVKASLVVEAASAGHWIAHAANLAMGDPRGPAHLIVDRRIAGDAALPVATSYRRPPLPPPDSKDLQALGDSLAAADRPLLVTGLECGPDDARWIRSFAEALPAPVLATSKGRGALADPHPLALGALTADHRALALADLVVLVGVDASELPPGVLDPAARVARIGRSPWPDDRLVAQTLGDLALSIEELAPRVRGRSPADWDVAAVDRIKRDGVQAGEASPVAPLVALAREATPAGTLVTGEGPVVAAWLAVAPRETLSPLGPAPPGYAVLAAVAAQLAHRDRRVVAFTTTRGLAASATLPGGVGGRLPIVVVTLDPPDRESTARAESARLGVFTYRDEHDFAQAFSRAFVSGQPAIVARRPH